MVWRILGVFLWFYFTLQVSTLQIVQGSFTKKHLSQLKNETRELIDHGWTAYMDNAYPADEIRPISCGKYEKVDDIYDIQRNDVLGNYSVTFVDTLTTFAIIGDVDRFREYIEVLRTTDFKTDSIVQVFETTIRALGSLLSCHLYASDHFKFPDYDGFLLDKAKELGDLLIRAYETSTSLPLARINLQKGSRGLPNSIVEETCTAGAATPMLEFTLLSILTNDTRYENASRTTFMKLWNSRSELDLVPMSLNPILGNWKNAITGIGASIDSFYEYALKGAILFDDDELEDIWISSYKSLSTHSRLEWFFTNVNVESGMIANPWIDALGAFFAGVLVLAGKVSDAIKIHQPYLKIWNIYDGIPERWDFLSPSGDGFSSGSKDPINLEWYPLRPEFIESTYYLYQATKDPFYLRVGEKVLKALKKKFKVVCGLAGYRDIRTGELQDRMESFVLSETLMYLYLLFDETNEINKNDQIIFSTEGHPLWVPKGILNGYKELKARNQINVSYVDPAEIEMNSPTIAQLMEMLNNLKGDELQGVLDYIHDIFESNTTSQLPDIEKLPELIHQISLFEKQDRSFYNFNDSCEVIKKSFFHSNQLNGPDLFTLDSKFKDQWNVTHIDGIETHPSFYSIYADNKAQCYKEPTVSVMDFRIGKSSQIRGNFLSTFVNPLTQKNDMWINDPEGLRIKLELLEIGKVDFSNNLIDESCVKLAEDAIDYSVEGTCKPEDKKKTAYVLRARVINEVRINDNMVYIADNDALREMVRKKMLGLTSKGNIVLDGVVVSNIKVWNV